MTVYLGVWNSFDGKKAGVLEIRHNIFPSGEIVQTYEFIGNGSTDGGVWEWIDGAGALEAHLTSNIRKSKVAVLRSANWGKTKPPAQPWFANPPAGKENQLLYLMANGTTQSCEWFFEK